IFAGSGRARSETIQQLSLGYNRRVDWFRIRAELFAMRVAGVIIPSRLSASAEETEIDGVPVMVYPGEGSKLPAVFGNLPDVFYIPGGSLRLEADLKQRGKVWAYYHVT